MQVVLAWTVRCLIIGNVRYVLQLCGYILNLQQLLGLSVLQLRSVHCVLSNMPLGLQRHGSEYGVHIICSMPVLPTGSVHTTNCSMRHFLLWSHPTCVLGLFDLLVVSSGALHSQNGCDLCRLVQLCGSWLDVLRVYKLPVLQPWSVRCLIGNVCRDLQCRRDRLGL